MAASTTLMTFMVRTPLMTRSVDLYGSWDNFTAAYPMTRDIRLGREHWTGCHSFENIICDGNVSETGFVRNGGLKMGGTYWYYYKLDDEIEFHNSAQPATTRCPLLPGQLINELQMPFALSGNRRRDTSISSTSSERRTLNPEAKFLNPQPGPATPKLVRLNTSPTVPLMSETESIFDDDLPTAIPIIRAEAEVPSRVDAPRMVHMPRKSSLDGAFKLGVAKPNPASLRNPVQIPHVNISVVGRGRYQEIIDWIPDQPAVTSSRGPSEITASVALNELRIRPSRGALLLRSNSDEVITLNSFREHRRQQSRSRSRDETPRNPLVFDEKAQLHLHNRPDDNGPLSALIEVNTPGTTPQHGPLTGRRITLEALEGRHEVVTQLEKRLPTLPSTPSSVYPPTTMNDSPPGEMTLALDELNSRFSATTVDTACHLNSMIMDEEQRRHFLDYTDQIDGPHVWEGVATHANVGTPLAGGCLSQPARSVRSDTTDPYESLDHDNYHDLRWLSSAVSYKTVSSTVSTTPTTSYGEEDTVNSSRFSHATSQRSSGAPHSNYQHYSLPEIENASEITLKRYDSKDRAVVNESGTRTARHRNSLSHSESMQQLLDELSYLSAMIQH